MTAVIKQGEMGGWHVIAGNGSRHFSGFGSERFARLFCENMHFQIIAE